MKFTEYLPIHEELYPKPTKKRLELDWEFWSIVAISIAAIILASLRTAHSFYTAAVLSSQVYNIDSGWLTQGISLTEAAAAMLAIEGGIVYGAVKRAKSKGKIHPRLFVVYISLLVAISIVAGLGQSLGLILGLSEGILVTFSWVMAVILGVGASVVAWLSGEMLGVELLRFEDLKKNADRAFTSASTRWLNEARKAWREARKEPNPVEVEVKPRKVEGSRATERIRAEFDKITMNEKRVPSAEEIAGNIGLSKGYVEGVLEDMRKGTK